MIPETAVADAWPNLSEAIKAGILAMIKAASPQSEVER